MGKGESTSCKQAINKWAKESGKDPSQCKKILLIAQIPSIKKMDNSLNQLVSCEHLGLSTNCIDRISPLPNLKKLKVLSLSRNNIRKIEKLDDLKDNLEQLWLSYNSIDKLDGLKNLNQLKILYLSNNNIKNFDELLKLQECASLSELLLLGNPIYNDLSIEQRRAEVIKRLPKLKKLDNVLISEIERDAAIKGDDVILNK